MVRGFADGSRSVGQKDFEEIMKNVIDGYLSGMTSKNLPPDAAFLRRALLEVSLPLAGGAAHMPFGLPKRKIDFLLRLNRASTPSPAA